MGLSVSHLDYESADADFVAVVAIDAFEDAVDVAMVLIQVMP